MRVLSTKKLTEPQQAYARQLGLEVEERMFIQVNHCPEVLFEDGEPLPILMEVSVDAWLISSANALPAIEALYPFLRPPAIGVVGEKTAAKLEERLGIRPDFVAHNAALLARKLVGQTEFNRFFFFSGNRRLETLPNALSAAGKEMLEWTVYETHLIPQQLTDCPRYVLFYSPTGVESFLASHPWKPEMTAVAIGVTTATAFHHMTGFEAYVSPAPTVEVVLDTAVSIYHPPTRQSF